MSENDIRKIFSKNLNYYLTLNNKTQKEVADTLNVGISTFNSWCTGQKMPRADKIQSIANWLGIEIGDLMQDKQKTELNKKDLKDIKDILEQTKQQLLNQEGLMFDGEPADEESIQSILNAMEIGMEMAKKKNKEKYTPKKYR